MMPFDDLEQRNAMLAAIIDSSEDAIISKDLNSIITSWNKAAERMFGYTESEMIGKSIYLLIPKERYEEEKMIISNLTHGRRIEHFETVRLTKAGNKLDISLTVSPIKNSLGVVVGASKIARDITRQKKDAKLISQYAQRLELINFVGSTISSQLNVNSILQIVTDATTQISGAEFGAFFYNVTDAQGEAYMLYTLSGLPKEVFENLGMPSNTEVFKITFDGLGIVRSDDITKDQRYGKNASHYGMPQGHLPVVSYLAVPIKSQTGIVIGGLFFGHPQPAVFTQEHEHLVGAIASQAAIALDNAKLYEEVKALNNKKDEYIAFASHELKTPLTTISGYIQLAKQHAQLPADIVDRVSKQVTRLNIIITDLLELSRIQAGKLNIVFKKVSLLAVIKESIDLVNFEQHTVVSEMPKDDILVTIDGKRISQVIINILTNAVKYSSPGSKIFITVVRVGDQIKISIEDEGIGISPQHLEDIFNQFYRVSKSSNIPGVGLGLYISKEIIEAHSGSIWAKSEEGKGSVFHIQFPIDRIKAR